MATNTLKTRIQLKYDSYDNWSSKNPVLLKGEIAIATLSAAAEIPEGSSIGNPNANVPNVVIKVGDGSTPYNQLKFVSALAADVYSWAKAESKPSYTAEEILGLDNFIAGEIQDTDTQYKIFKDGTHGIILKSRAKGETEYTNTVASISFDELATKTEVQTVQTNLTNALAEGGAVEQKIAANNANLKADGQTAGTGEVISKVTQAGGIISVEKKTLTAADIPELAQEKITGLVDALAGKQAKFAAVDGEVTETNPVATKSTVDSAITANNQGLANQDAAVENQFVTAAVQTNGVVVVSRSTITENSITGEISQAKVTNLVNDLAAKQEKLGFATGENAYDKVSNPVTTQDYVDKKVADVVADLNGAMHFRGEVEKNPNENTAEENATYIGGDVVIFGIIEYVYDGNGNWIELGAEGIYKTKEEYNTEHKAVTDRLTALEDGKQDNLVFDQTYNAETNKVATVATANKAASDAIGALDVPEKTFAQGKILNTIKQEDGFISVTERDLAVADIPTLPESKIDGLTTKLNGMQTLLDTLPAGAEVATKQHVTDSINDTLDTLNGGNTEADLTYVTEVKETKGIIEVKTKTLAKVAETGNVNDLTQTEGDWLILDCGSATEVMPTA